MIGIPEKRVVESLNNLIGTQIGAVATGREKAPQPDIVSGATVTILVAADSIVRSAVQLIKNGRIGSSGQNVPSAAATVKETIDLDKSEVRNWEDLVGDGSVRRLHMTVGEVSAAFERSGNSAAAAHPESDDPEESFIDLYVALASVPTIGRSLLGDAGYAALQRRLKPGQNAILVAGSGLYSFKGSGYVRGGIFDRIQLIQEGAATRFRDRNHRRLGAIEAEGAPDSPEIGLFIIPENFTFNPVSQWQLQLLAQRATGPRDKAFLAFDIAYKLPDRYIKREPLAPVAVAPPAVTTTEAPAAHEEAFWKQMWVRSPVSIGITVAALAILTIIFFFQNVLVRRPVLFTWVRRVFLTFTLVWLGWYANAQLSVVNVIVFANSLATGFHWEYFLTSPLIFILWSAVAAALIFWARGPFCGWLCPFGALQELTNTIAKALHVPQIRVPWGLHERLWPIKYIIFLVLFGMSLYSVAFAEQLAEVEPFKTAIILKFMRDWPYVLYAATLLVAGLFVERFFCRYLCPLGAALAIPGRLRTFEWLRRWPECGSPCHRCANECPVQAIHPEGHINVNECIYCMHCQELYWDDHRCPHMIQVRLKRERREALTSPAMRGKGPLPPIVTAGGKPVSLPTQTLTEVVNQPKGKDHE